MSKASPFNYTNPTAAEQSFRELIKDVPWINHDPVISTVKDIAVKSFGVRNLFELGVVDNGHKVRAEFNRPLLGDCSDCVSIPLKARGSIYHIRLLVDEFGAAYIEYRYEQHDAPAIQPVGTHQLKKALARLMPTVYHPNCPVE